MKLNPKSSPVIPNLLVAAAISLVVNFSYLILLLVDQKVDPMRPPSASDRMIVRNEVGILHIHPDGHGYLVYPNGDSLYMPMSRIHRFNLADSDQLEVGLMPRRGGHPVVCEIQKRNGERFDPASVFNRTSRATDALLQWLFYSFLSFVLLNILTAKRRSTGWRWGWCIIAILALYFVAPNVDWRSGRIELNFMSRQMLDYMLLLRYSFAIAASLLYGRIYALIRQRQEVVVENAQLKNENLTTRYNLLVGQINPHFFFNSLNSLAMLVREKQDQKALTYIDQLSYTFRYIIQNGQSTLSTLDEELKFAEAYSYLFKIRYADKLFFDIAVDPQYLAWQLPALSLQPLIGNAVKHNTITRNNPFHLSIRTEGDWLVISNPKLPKLEPEPSTGIGLENLRNRWKLITGCDIEVIDTPETFTVRLPLQSPTAR